MDKKIKTLSDALVEFLKKGISQAMPLETKESISKIFSCGFVSCFFIMKNIIFNYKNCMDELFSLEEECLNFYKKYNKDPMFT